MVKSESAKPVKVPAEPKPRYPTQEVVPRNYCIVWYGDNNHKFYMDPATHVIAGALIRSPAHLAHVLGYGLAYNKRYEQLAKEGRPPYVPKHFRWDGKYLEMTPEKLAEEMREAIKKVEGQYTLWDTTPSEAFQAFTLRGEVLGADVKSKSPKDTGDAYHKGTSVRSVFLRDGCPDLLAMSCGCQDHKWADTKGGKFYDIRECMHIAAMMEAFNSQLGPNPEVKGGERTKNRSRFSPFRFAGNWGERDGTACFRDPHLAALEADVLCARYLGRQGYTEINRKLAALPIVLDSSLQLARASGKARFEILKHSLGESDISRAESSARAYVARQLAVELYRHGYSRTSEVFSLGYPAVRYEKGAGGQWNAVDVVFSPDNQFCVVNTPGTSDALVTPSEPSKPVENPVSMLGREESVVDDATGRRVYANVQMPSCVRLPEGGRDGQICIAHSCMAPLKKHWCGQVASLGERTLKYARLFY